MALLFEKVRSLWSGSQKEPKPADEALPASLSILWHRLPQEIRDEIWIHVFTLNDRIRVVSRVRPSKAARKTVALLRTSKAVYHRHRPAFWSRNVFGMGFRARTSLPLIWSLPPGSQEHIRTLCLDVAELAEVYKRLPTFHGLKRVYVENIRARPRSRRPERPGMSNVVQAAKTIPAVEFVVVTGTIEFRYPEMARYTAVAVDQNGEAVVTEIQGFEDERALPWWVRK